jgi:DNA-directed RNA polymerase subunit H (RpoH/RPB5)
MIDTHSERLNIKDLAIEIVNKKEPIFNPVKDIPDDAWKHMGRSLSNGLSLMMTDPGTAVYAIEAAAQMRLLAGENSSRLPRISERDWDIVKTRIVRGDIRERLKQLRSAHILDPQRAKEPAYRNNKIDCDLVTYLPVEHYATDEYFQMLSSVKITDPQQVIEITEERWAQLQDRVREFNESKLDRHGIDKRMKILELVNNLKIINPEKAKIVLQQIRISKSEAKADLNELLNRGKQRSGWTDSMREYTNYAYNLYLFSSEEIKVTDNGLELVMPQQQSNLSSGSNPPEMRKF